MRICLLLNKCIKKWTCEISLISSIILIMTFTSTHTIFGLENDHNSSNSQGVLSIVTNNPSSSIDSKPVLLDPNPLLIDKNGNLKNNDINLAASIKTIRSGTVADGVSKLLVQLPYTSKLQFSIKGLDSDNLSDGTLAPLFGSNESASTTSPQSPSSSTTVDSQRTNNGDSVVIAVYTPPTSFGLLKTDHKTIKVVIRDPTDPSFGLLEIPIQLHKVPVVLVHGIWGTPRNTWIDTNFKKTLESNGFKVYFADYSAHNAETFDPYGIPKIGNNGIDAINKTISAILKDYHLRSIANSQVDMVGHSIGGLMVRGYVQQSYYNNEENYMKGYVHRLITIGTPHFGAPLSKILHGFQDEKYCYDRSTHIFTSIVCIPNAFPGTWDWILLDLKTIYGSEYKLPIDKGGVNALIPGSRAYSHMCPTNVKSYAIVGVWEPSDIRSRTDQELLFKTIKGRLEFDLDRDAFQGRPNDLLVSVTSQAGGLPSRVVNPGQSLPDKSAMYPSTIHALLFTMIDPLTLHDIAETTSPIIQRDVVILLGSSDNKFSDVIGVGSTCHIPISS